MRDAGSVVTTYTIAVLPGDGIGPEVIAEAERALEAAGDRFAIEFTLRRFPLGAAGVAAAGDPFPEETRAAVARADAVLLGAVGDPSLDQAPRHLRPEFGLLALRAQLGVYANLHPVAVLLALTTGTIVAGILGAILAVPTLSIILAIISYYRGENPELVEAAAEGSDQEPEPLRKAAG